MKNLNLELEMLEDVLAPGSARDFAVGFLAGVGIVAGSAGLINIITGGALAIAFT